ncbi:hypothetical protein C5167_044192 [Papaver somniferum]|uniref:Uncharacterized protein n=1 Tax=Papaver somniferum TaxID=3469 RepID=A0A4Y7LBS7_PAPSO|nr:hypothetical protein C5167_044192 [Papaver somniferum]
MAVVPKWFLHSSKRNLQRLELGLINQFMTVMSWMAFAKKTVDSFVLAMRFGQTVQQVMTLTNLLSLCTYMLHVAPILHGQMYGLPPEVEALPPMPEDGGH